MACLAPAAGLQGQAYCDPARQVRMEAITAAISQDWRVGVGRSRLLRTIFGMRHCPLPTMPEWA